LSSSSKLEWEIIPFTKLIDRKKYSIGKKQRKDYSIQGKYPIIDQGQDSIAGYANDEKLVYDGELPVIIFGDHTRFFKFIDFPFIAGADGTQIIVPKKDVISPKYFYYALLNTPLISRGYSRHFSLLKQKNIPVPPLVEQLGIAEVLGTVDEAIRRTDAVIAKTEELKRGLMQRLLTRGIGHTEFKDTPIGRIPITWVTKKLSELCKIRKKKTYNKLEKIANIPMEKISEKNIYVNYDMVNNFDIKSGNYCEGGDILIATITPSFENGKQGIVPEIPNNIGITSTEALPIVVNEDVDKLFIFYTLKRPLVRNIVASRMVGSTGRQRVPPSVLKQFQIPVPPLEEQIVISKMLQDVDNKILMERASKEQNLKFRQGLMQVLLSGKVRVRLDESGLHRVGDG